MGRRENGERRSGAVPVPRRRGAGLLARAVVAVLAAAAPALPAAPTAGLPAAGVPAVAARAGAPPAERPPTSAPATHPSITLLPSSRVTFEAHDPLETIDGHLAVAQARLSLDPSRPDSARGSLTVRTASIDTGNALRDQNARRALFDSARYPTATFTLQDVTADPAVLNDGGTSRLHVSGTLELHGVTRTLTADGTVTRHGARLDATLAAELALTDFGMTRPRFLFIQVDDRVTLRVVLAMTAGPAAGPGTAR